MLAWLGCHTACFTRLGGVPATVRIDNEKTAIVRGAGVWGRINPTYRRYATVLHFHIDACPPRQPQSKGKVERRVRDQRFALDPRRHAWDDLAELQRWTDAQLEGYRQVGGGPACRAGSGQIGRWDDDCQPRPLCRVSLPA